MKKLLAILVMALFALATVVPDCDATHKRKDRPHGNGGK